MKKIQIKINDEKEIRVNIEKSEDINLENYGIILADKIKVFITKLKILKILKKRICFKSNGSNKKRTKIK